MRSQQEGRPAWVLVVGAGTHFLSAMSYYTTRLTNALVTRYAVAIVPMRQLIPTFLYPGRSRVGLTTTSLQYDRAVKVLGGVDWYWIPSLFRDLNDLRKWKPDVVIFEWWTGSVLHTYLTIALFARVMGASILVEFHEVQDTGEARIPIARGWVSVLGRPFFKLASAFVIHSEADREVIERRYRPGDRPCVVILHGPLDHHAPKEAGGGVTGAHRTAPPEALNLLFFGIIRPYKGLEDLVQAFEMFDEEEVKDYWLTVVGETWEGWDLPIQMIRDSRYRSRITLVNRFVEDDEVIAHFANADAAVLPYHRSSASSPAHVAMSTGLPLVITAVGGLPEAVAEYEGAILVPPHRPPSDPKCRSQAPRNPRAALPGPHSWERTVAQYEKLLAQIGATDSAGPGPWWYRRKRD